MKYRVHYGFGHEIRMETSKGKSIVRTFNLRTLLTAAALGLAFLLGTSQLVNAQDRSRDDRKQEQARKQQEKKAAEQARESQRREGEWNTRNRQIANDNVRRNRNFRANTNVVVVESSDRYRVYRNGSYYNTDVRGAEVLRQAVNEGYRQGFAAGRSDRDRYRRSSWSTSNVYRSGSVGYNDHVDRNQYQYYFQQGFQRGYQDGSNRRFNDGYNGNFDYGYYQNGTLTVIGAILDTVLNISRY